MRSTVLIIDDEPGAATELGAFVELEGWGAVTARGGGEALDLLRHRGDIGLVITDLFMDGMSGFDVIQKARAMLSKPPAFVVATSYPAYDLAVRAIHNSVLDFLKKPTAPETLIATLDRAVALGYLAPRDAQLLPDSPVSRAIADLVQVRRAIRDTLVGDLGTELSLDILLSLADAESRGEDLSVSALAAAAALPKTSVLRHLTDLETAGLVRRDSTPSDRRVTRLRLTAEGRERVAIVAERVAERPQAAVRA